MESRRPCPVWLAHFTECSILQLHLLWQWSDRPLRLNGVLLSAWTPVCPSFHLSGSWGCFLPSAAAMTRLRTRGARVSLRPCFPPAVLGRVLTWTPRPRSSAPQRWRGRCWGL